MHPARDVAVSRRFHVGSSLRKSCYFLEPNLRYALRQETRKEHAELDRLISTLNITTRSGFGMFLQLHLNCFCAMQSRLSSECRCSPTLEDMILGLQADLAAVSADPMTLATDIPTRLDPLAIDYIVSGSRLGSKILCGIWAQTDDPVIRRAGNYFMQTNDANLWRDTCQALSQVPLDSPRAAMIMTDTRALFGLFITTFDAVAANQDTFA